MNGTAQLPPFTPDGLSPWDVSTRARSEQARLGSAATPDVVAGDLATSDGGGP